MSVLWYWETKLVIQVQRCYCREHGEQAPVGQSMKRWLEPFQERDNVWCALSRHEVIGPSFFQGKTVHNTNYLNMLGLFAVPQMAHLQPNVFFQQDGGTSPHWGLTVREYLNKTFPNRWIGRDGPIAWPPRSPDITPLDFFF
jgi:hypothetical protein